LPRSSVTAPVARLTSKTSSQTFVTQWGSTAADQAFAAYIESGSLKFRATNPSNSAVDLAYSWTPSLGVWYHICFERDGTGKVRIYIDGAMVASHASSLAFDFKNSTSGLAIGAIGTTASFPSFDFNGWLDEWRITKGVARYASDGGFTVPAAAYPRT
jgi:hypothetical protein